MAWTVETGGVWTAWIDGVVGSGAFAMARLTLELAVAGPGKARLPRPLPLGGGAAALLRRLYRAAWNSVLKYASEADFPAKITRFGGVPHIP